MANIVTPDMGNNEYEVHPYDSLPEVDTKLLSTLSKIMARNDAQNRFLFVRADNTGRLLVSTSAAEVTVAAHSAVNVTVAGQTLLNANTARVAFLVQNLGAADIYIRLDAIPSLALGIKLAPNDNFVDDTYVGAVSAITLVGNADVRIMEY